MIRRQLVGAALTAVVIAVIGLLYVQAMAQSHANRVAWMVTRDVAAGAVLDDANVRRVRVPSTGDQFAVLEQSPLHRRAAHRMAPQTLLAPDDLLPDDMVQVPVSVRVAPGLSAGDTLDVYAVVATRTVLVGRRIVVIATGNPMTLLVPAGDEASWVALEANNVSLFAAKSSGIGVPSTAGVGVGDALANLSGTAQPGLVLIGPAGASGSAGAQLPAPAPVPATPVPGSRPSPSGPPR